eukprot:jgi/Botrbrau1/7471/Bobra.0095s0009.1
MRGLLLRTMRGLHPWPWPYSGFTSPIHRLMGPKTSMYGHAVTEVKQSLSLLRQLVEVHGQLSFASWVFFLGGGGERGGWDIAARLSELWLRSQPVSDYPTLTAGRIKEEVSQSVQST